ncbi:MAG TPA: type II toxin-antitoxin system prevent-host-death family antitoxin [Pirellulales bacterium]|nr:type II toxin-antitoxin system prevent-host-death family antitoxin [Pirellulales bacterium]
MVTVSLTELQQNTVGLLARVEAGEHLLVVRGGRPVAELRPIAVPRPGPRPFGLAAGAFVVPDDFDAPLPEDILREFEGLREFKGR